MSTNSFVFVIFLIFRCLTIFFAIFEASFSSPKILITNFNSISLKLLITSNAEISFSPIVIFNFFLDLKEKPLSKSSSWIDDKPKSNIATSKLLQEIVSN